MLVGSKRKCKKYLNAEALNFNDLLRGLVVIPQVLAGQQQRTGKKKQSYFLIPAVGNKIIETPSNFLLSCLDLFFINVLIRKYLHTKKKDSGRLQATTVNNCSINLGFFLIKI